MVVLGMNTLSILEILHISDDKTVRRKKYEVFAFYSMHRQCNKDCKD